MYAKLFASLYQGTLRGCSDEILVFTNLLAHADATGIVDKHWRAISEETGLSRERVESAINNLEAPDLESRSPEMEGRRIVRIDEHRAWGWKIVNYGKYRAIRNEEDRREQNRLAQEKWRNKQNKPRKPESAQAEGEEEAKERTTLSGKPDVNPQKEKNQEANAAAIRLLTFLNEKTGRAYRPVPANLSLIAARLREGATEQDCRSVIAKKSREWLKDEKMSAYLRPETLFGARKFAQYVGELV